MVLSVLVAVLAAPGLLGTQEAIRQSQAKEKKEEHRARRCNLIVTCVKSPVRSREIDGRPIVLRNGKLFIDTGSSNESLFGHQYAGYYLPYPDADYEGLVTTITDEAPILNWVYIDKATHEVKYGVRVSAQPNFTGPFDCTRQDRRLTFDGWEGWCAVEESNSIWAIYFDRDDDGLRSKLAPGTRVLEIELTRREKRWNNKAEFRQEDQTTKRQVDIEANSPIDKTVDPQPHYIQPPVADANTDLNGLDSPTPWAPAVRPLNLPKTIFPGEPPLNIPRSVFLDGSSFGQPDQTTSATHRPQLLSDTKMVENLSQAQIPIVTSLEREASPCSPNEHEPNLSKQPSDLCSPLSKPGI